ncbi:MAG: VWA domain-containing protein [Planctomycetes bacterium]|nr:VWA domain-containing protein [Planctomycetota bacterium]
MPSTNVRGGLSPGSTVYGFGGGGGGGGHQYPGTSHLFGRAGGRGGVGGQGPSLPNYSAVLLDENLRLRLGDSGGIGNGAGVHLVKSAGSITVEGGVGNRTPGYFYFGSAGGGGAGGSIALYAKRPLGIAIGAVVNQADDDVVFFDPATIVRTETGFTFREVSISPDVMVTVTGTLPADILSLKETSPPESTSETFAPLPENPWTRPVGEAALSTFSVDVDTASYSIVRRCLVEQGRLPPRDAVRLEELVNWFDWDYAPPAGADPFAVHLEAAACPWEPAHRLVRVALKGRVVEEAERPAANLVFLLDVSGSMDQPNKLPLVQRSLELLAGRLDARDRVSIVVYAGASGLVLPPTRGDDRAAIRAAVANLRAGGSTNGGAGIELAYRIAEENLIPGGINRVLLATDGDFNVGVTDPAALVSLVEEKAKSKVFLTALGFGMDNLKDATLERLADRGNGNYAYVDDLAEARKVLVEQGMSTLHAIAKDVKIQVEWNPAQVAGYRLLGYENRLLAAQDFADDAKDAGEIGAGHSVTAFYEVVPFGREVPGGAVDGLRYQRPAEGTGSLETLTVKLRWKEPEGEASTLREIPFVDAGGSFDGASGEFRFAAAVAEWALLLRGSRFAGSASLDAVREIAAGALGADGSGRRAEFLRLVEKSAALSK